MSKLTGNQEFNGEVYIKGIGGYDGTNIASATSVTEIVGDVQRVTEGICWEYGNGAGSIQPKKGMLYYEWKYTGHETPPVNIKEGAAGATRYLVSSPANLPDCYPIGTYFTIDKTNVGALVSFESSPAASNQWYMTLSSTLNPDSSLSDVAITFYTTSCEPIMSYCSANGYYSYVEGYNTQAGGTYSTKTAGTHDDETEFGKFSHAEGNANIVLGNASHVEGEKNRCDFPSSHVEGYNNTTSAGNPIGLEYCTGNHVEGTETYVIQGMIAAGCHVEGYKTKVDPGASGNIYGAHAEGRGTITRNSAEHAEGQYNVSHCQSSSYGSSGNTQHSVGIGTSSSDEKNAFEIMQNGDVYVIGIGGYDGTNLTSASTIQEVIGDIETLLSRI